MVRVTVKREGVRDCAWPSASPTQATDGGFVRVAKPRKNGTVFLKSVCSVNRRARALFVCFLTIDVSWMFAARLCTELHDVRRGVSLCGVVVAPGGGHWVLELWPQTRCARNTHERRGLACLLFWGHDETQHSTHCSAPLQTT